MTGEKEKTIMKRRYYTKIRNHLCRATIMYAQAKDGEVYLADGYLIVCMPDWMYREQFVDPDEKNFSVRFPVLMDGEKLTRDAGEIKEDGPDLAAFFHDWLFGRYRDYTLVRNVIKGRHEGHTVRFCDTGRQLPIILSNVYFEAMEQATRGGIMYGDLKNRPVYFFDSDQIHASAFCGCVLPINYNPDTVQIPA